MTDTPEWVAANRANWDERVRVHLGPNGYKFADLRAGQPRLGPIVEVELGSVVGKRVLHLQCHFGTDSLRLAQLGAEVVGLDFSPAAIRAACDLAKELGLAERARFVLAELYDAPSALAEPASFDFVYVTWGAISWLHDIDGWARVVAHFLRPGGELYLAEQHPVALVLDDRVPMVDGRPTFHVPYALEGPLVSDDARDYADDAAVLRHTRQYNFMHALGDVVNSVLRAGLRLDWLHEHPAIGWRLFEGLTRDADGLYRWPDKPWLPLAFSLRA